MKLTRLRPGELIALMGVICVIIALTRPWYENSNGLLSAWDTFGPSVALIMLAALLALLLVLTTVTERSTALPVVSAVWSTLFGIIATIAAVIRVLERPQDATSLCAGTWLGLAGAVLIAVGSWQSMRDERPRLYPPVDPESRKPSFG